MNITLGVLAHVDAGKTTFAEQVLYHRNTIRNRGRVDHKNSFMDSHSIEKERGITVFSDQAVFDYEDSRFFLIDTPGHVDFSSEMERALMVMDYAVIIISGVEGVQGHTETVWQLLRKHGIPTFFFVNKMDREGADIEARLDEIRRSLTGDVLYLTGYMNGKELGIERIEELAERDEALLELFLSGNPMKESPVWLNFMKKQIKEGKLFPCFSGSALQDIGIEDFLEKLHLLAYTDYEDAGDISGRVYKIRYDEKGNRVTFVKLLSGNIRIKDELQYIDNENIRVEKIHEIRRYNGNRFQTVDSGSAGELFGLVGLTALKAGDGLGLLKEKLAYEMVPTLRAKVLFPSNINGKEVLSYFRILEAEDPALNISWEEELAEIQVQIMGVIQLEVLKQVFAERFNVPISFGDCEILYKETIKDCLFGFGHFEPLMHYAEVHLKIEPGERGTGICFKNECHADDMTTGNQNLVGTHLLEKEHRGVLTGAGLTDLIITLLTGRAHNMHTSGGDFREATLRALRQGLESGLEEDKCVLLEPYYRFRLDADLEHMGRLLSDIQKLNGSFEPPIMKEDRVLIIGRGPVATFMNYSVDFVSITKGKGKIGFAYDGYEICHNQKEVINRIGYDRDGDVGYPAYSIFCAKGQGYVVSSKDAKAHMHCSISDK